MKLHSITVKRFKKVLNAEFNAGNVNVLIGGNNSGKSTIAQAMHFGIALLQSIFASEGKWPKGNDLSISLNPSDIIYCPSEDIYALGTGATLKTDTTKDKSKSPTIRYTLDNGESFSIAFCKGKNRNIAVSVTNAKVAQELAKLDSPFSVFSPGLAGISKKESYISDGVLFRALARGDANLVLRNILQRLWPGNNHDNTEKGRWDNFLSELREVFPDIDIKVHFNSSLDEYIDVKITTNGIDWVPLEIAGTGVLQATQILSYIHRFQPSLMVLDEPDSHLHPDNQRLLCSMFQRIANSRDIQIVLTTHSRHVIDAIGASSNVLWVREGSVDIASQDDEIGILMEIGALDIRERIGQDSTTAVILTEDEDSSYVKSVAESSGFMPDKTVVQPYYGVTSLHNLRPLISMIKQIKPTATIVVHRDRDYLSSQQVSDWKTEVIKLKAEPFITDGIDIESHFLNTKYLSSQNEDISEQNFEDLLNRCIEESLNDMIKKYVNGRVNVARHEKKIGNLDHGELAVEAQESVTKHPSRYVCKATLKSLRCAFKNTYGSTLNIGKSHSTLKCEDLFIISKKTKKLPRTSRKGAL